jgi:hypothetical protein
MRWGDGDPATGPKTAFPRCQAERRASYNPIVRPVGSSGPSVMTLILIGKIATSCGFVPTAKSIGPPVERADVASLLKQTVAGRGSLDFGADRRTMRRPRAQAMSAPRTRAELFGASVELTPRESKRRKSRGRRSRFSRTWRLRTHVACAAQNLRPWGRCPRDTCGLASHTLDHAPRYAGCHRQIAQAHRCWANSKLVARLARS